MALPYLETIEVDTPPVSPILFADDSFDIPSIEGVTSPTKRVRSVGNVSRSKRQKTNSGPNFEHIVDELIAPHETYDPTEEPPHSNEVVVDDYARYIIAVKDEVAGFYPLSDDLFIVQGWDDKSHGAKPVSSILC